MDRFSKDFFTTFKINSVGKFTLTISNQGSSPVNVDGLFGYIPFVGQNNQVNLSPLNGIIIDSSICDRNNSAYSGYHICHYR